MTNTVLNKIKVCHLTTGHPPLDTRIFVRECSTLKKNERIDLYLAAFDAKQKENNITFFDLGVKPKSRFWRILNAQLAAIRVLVKINPQVWHLHDPELIPFGICMCLLRKKVIWDAHEDYFTQFSRELFFRTYIPVIFRGLISKAFISMLKLLDRICFAVITVSEQFGEFYKSRNLVIVGNEAIVQTFADCSPNFYSKKVLFTGSMSEEYCFKEIVKVVYSKKDFSLVVAGKSNMESENYARNLLGQRFEHVGWKSQIELAKLINDCSVGVVSYVNSPIYKNNRPNKFYEFAAAGLPILATPTESSIELLSNANNGVLSNDFSEKSLSEGLLSIMKDIEIWDEMRSNGKKWSELHGNWNLSAMRLSRIYDELINVKEKA